MAVRNPMSITYGGLTVGGTSDVYLIDGAYQIDKAFESVRIAFDVVVVGTSYADLVSKAGALEAAYDNRDSSLAISIDGAGWTYSSGTSILNPTSSITKSGDRERDRGYSRAYTCVVEGELPASDQNGLRDLSVSLSYDAGRRRTVTMSGTYTSIGGSGARQTYEGDFDSEASTILTAIDSGATFELVDEGVSNDRNNHLADFSRTYVELLFDQVDGTLDDANIRDHRVNFTLLLQHPGDGQEGVTRLRRVAASYDCAIDIDETTDVRQVYEDSVRDYIKSVFEAEYNPAVFAVEDEKVSIDETGKRLSAALVIVFQPKNRNPGEKQNIVETSQSLAYRENRTIDYTPVHTGSEFAFNVDPGWATKERVWTRTVISVGNDKPRQRIGTIDKGQGTASGAFDTAIEGDDTGLDTRITPFVKQSGWNVVSNSSQVSDQWIGDSFQDGDQLKLAILTETVVERYSKGAGGATSGIVDIGTFL